MQFVPKLLKWLRKQYPPENRGTRRKLARDLGVDGGYASKLLCGKATGDIGVSKLEHLAVEAGFSSVWRLAREIETEKVDRRQGPTPINERYRRKLTELYLDLPLPPEKIIMTLEQLRELGYNHLIFEIARLLIANGPVDCMPLAARLLIEFGEKPSAQLTRKRRQMHARYEELD